MKCRNCGTECDGKARQCPECGTLLIPFSKLYPPQPPLIVKGNAGKVLATIFGALSTVIVVVCLVTIFLRIIPVSSGDELTEEEYAEMWNRIDELTFKGSAADYNSLIQARDMIEIAKAHMPDDSLNSVIELNNKKLAEAHSAWIKAAKAQFQYASNLEAALRYFNRADSILPASPELITELRDMQKKTGLASVALLISDVSVTDSEVNISGRYYGDISATVTLRVNINGVDHEAFAFLSVEPNVSFGFTNNAPISGDNHVEIYQGDQLIYTNNQND